MSMAEPLVTPRTPEEEDNLIKMRYGVKPTPGCQLMPPDIKGGWTVTAPAIEEAKSVPNTATVFGGTGMLGRSLLKKIGTKYEKIRVASRNPASAEAKLKGIEGNFEYVEASVENYDQVEHACEGAGTVVNLVGILFETADQHFHKIQFEGARNVAQASSVVGAETLIHMSAIGAVDASLSKYAQSKGWGEGAVRAKFPSASILRPSVVFGPEDNFFNQFANFPLPFLPLVGGGKTKFQPVYVEDVTDAIVKCTEGGGGKTYELGGPDVYTFKELMTKVGEMTGKSKMMLPIPFELAEVQGWFMELAPTPMVTVDQVRLLKSDNVVADDAPSFKDLGIVPKPVDEIVPGYLN
jgi:NADH dehydrogenase